MFLEGIKANYKFFLLAFLITAILTPIAVKLMPKWGYLDIPKDNRRMHKVAMPVAGGVAMFIAFLITMPLAIEMDREFLCLLIGSAIIVVSGLIDDKIGLSPKMKILFQIAASAALIVGGVKIRFFTNPWMGDELIWLNYLSVPITIFWIVGITNTVNLIDGLDGLAAGVSMICAISLMFIAYKFGSGNQALVAAIIAGACLGFLPFNFHPAKIFMGDTGALFLGFVLSYISIGGFMKSATILTIFVPVLILGVPVFDTAFAMVRRKLSGHSMVEADKGHLHHRLLKMGLSQRQTVLTLYSISIIFGILANVIADIDPRRGFVLSILIIAAIVLVAGASGMFKSVRGEKK